MVAERCGRCMGEGKISTFWVGKPGIKRVPCPECSGSGIVNYSKKKRVEEPEVDKTQAMLMSLFAAPSLVKKGIEKGVKEPVKATKKRVSKKKIVE